LPHAYSGHKTSPPLPPGTRVGDQYRIIRMLGQPGRIGITYLAKDEVGRRDVAIKEFIPRDFARRHDSRPTITTHAAASIGAFQHGLQRFIAEARLLAKVDHVHVIGVQTVFELNGTAYLVTDYHQGRTLADHLAASGGRLHWQTAVEICLRILDGLHAAHGQGIVHRDVNPGNIYLTTTGVPILLDFGAARQAIGERTGKLNGFLTHGYAAPEQYGTRTGNEGPWTDVHAVGGVLFRVITGAVPPDALSRANGDPLPRISEHVPEVPAALTSLIGRAVSINRTERFQTAWEFSDALDALLPPPHLMESGGSDASRSPQADVTGPRSIVRSVVGYLRGQGA
jgi:serine/threonine protein kinase